MRIKTSLEISINEFSDKTEWQVDCFFPGRGIYISGNGNTLLKAIQDLDRVYIQSKEEYGKEIFLKETKH